MSNLSNLTVNAFKWNTISQANRFFLKFTLGVILARLLSPEEFGLVALITVITEIANFFIDGGFSASLIQNKKVNDNDFSTIFYINLSIGFFFTIVFFLSAPLFAKFYAEPRLENITKILSFVYLLNSLTVVQKAYFIRNIDFKKISIIDMINQTLSSLLGISLALLGFSFWALVWNRVFASFNQVVLYFYFTKWYPLLHFEKKILKKHWKFSSRVFIANIFRKFSENFDLIVVGKLFLASGLAIFQRGRNYAFLPVNFTSSVINKTLFSTFSKFQSNSDRFLKNYIKVYRLITFFVLPIIVLLFLNAKEFILILIGNKWFDAIPFLKLFCIAGFIYVLNANKFNSLGSLGFPGYSARFNIFDAVSKPLLILLLYYFYNIEMKVVAMIFIFFFVLKFNYASYHLSIKLKTSFVNIAFSNYRELLIIIIAGLSNFFIINYIGIQDNIIKFIVSILLFLSIYVVSMLKFEKDIYIEIKHIIGTHLKKI